MHFNYVGKVHCLEFVAMNLLQLMYTCSSLLVAATGRNSCLIGLKDQDRPPIVCSNNKVTIFSSFFYYICIFESKLNFVIANYI